MEFNFKKEIYTTPELLKEVSISKATFYRYQSGWLTKGNCLSDMGKFTLKGSKRSYWLIRKFMGWLIETQVNEKKTFNNEVRDQQIAIGVLKGFKNEQE